jgi:hypothetical protein
MSAKTCHTLMVIAFVAILIGLARAAWWTVMMM